LRKSDVFVRQGTYTAVLDLLNSILPGKKYPDQLISELFNVEYISAYHSHPRWIVEKWLTELGSIKEVESLCQANNIDPPLTIWVNSLKSDIGSLEKALDEEFILQKGRNFRLLA
jgi:16S rRNA C967 or C1407 C5-methylase (RsmB/RsmF family)